jgi:hypothetical protein
MLILKITRHTFYHIGTQYTAFNLTRQSTGARTLDLVLEGDVGKVQPP